MSNQLQRELREGDRVTATGIVTECSGTTWISVDWDNSGEWSYVPRDSLVRVAAPEPSEGSVVVKDGIAWTRGARNQNTPTKAYWHNPAGLDYASRWHTWDEISDGEVIHFGGGA